jgi:hypothetical protein
MDKKFNEVRDYLYDNPDSGIEEVCEAVGVETADIHRWLTEGRLILAHGSSIVMHCEKCGAPIQTGKLCDQCLGKLHNKLQEAADILKPPEPKKPLSIKEEGRMHLEIRKK